MRALHHLLGTSALALAGLAIQASEFTPLLSVAQSTWPDRNHIGVVCNYAESKDRIQSLREAAGPNATITVVDARSASLAPAARSILLDRHANYLVLMPGGRVFREGSFEATQLVRTLASSGIPSIGTTPRAIAQGALFAVGEQTGWTLLVTDHLVGTITVELPQKGLVFGPAAGGGASGGAELEVVGMGE